MTVALYAARLAWKRAAIVEGLALDLYLGKTIGTLEDHEANPVDIVVVGPNSADYVAAARTRFEAGR